MFADRFVAMKFTVVNPEPITNPVPVTVKAMPVRGPTGAKAKAR